MDYIVIFDVIIVILGVYLIYAALQMKRTGEISTVIINRMEIGNCRDKRGFIDRIYKQTLIFGGVALAFGILGGVNDMVFSLGRVYDIGSVIVFLIVWFWFTKAIRKGRTEFFY